MPSLSKRPITLVQIDLPYCLLTYGVGACDAVLGTTGEVKCYNTRRTCQSIPNYDAGIKTITLAYNQDGVPDIPGVFPCLQSVSSRPGRLNLSGFNPNSVALGMNARVTIDCLDFADADTWLDKYQSERVDGTALSSGVGFSPFRRGTFFARLFARFPYYLGIPLRVLRGFVGQAIGDMATEHYVITEVTGPNSAGAVRIVAKDVLDLADDEKAVYPPASLGKIATGIGISAESVELQPAGIGATYPLAGLAIVGREILLFTRSGDTVFFNGRGLEGTTAAAHNAGDVFQICGVLEGLTIAQTIETILKSETTQFDDFIDVAAWTEENDTWLSGLTIGRVIIPRPTGKKRLVGELCQLGVLVWWDPVAQEIRFKVNSPLLPDETYYPVNDMNSLIEKTVDVKKAEDQRASSVWVYHGVRDWTEDVSNDRNYTRLSIAAPPENLYGQEALKFIYTRWFGREGQDFTASIIAERLLSRYQETPDIVSGMLDVKDRADVSLGSRLQVETYQLQDVDGATLAVPMQVLYAEYSDNRVKFEAETYDLNGQFGFWMEDGTAPADYDSATPAQRAAGAFWGDATAPNEDEDYVYF